MSEVEIKNHLIRLTTQHRTNSAHRMRNAAHEKEMEFVKQRFKKKLHHLERYLIIKKKYAGDDVLKSVDDFGSDDVLKSNQVRKIKNSHNTVEAYGERQSQFDAQLEAIMDKLSSKYDIKKMIPLITGKEKKQIRRQMIADILDTLQKHIQEQEDYLFDSVLEKSKSYDRSGSYDLSYSYSASKRVDKANLKERLFEEKQNVRMLEYMLDQFVEDDSSLISPATERVITHKKSISKTAAPSVDFDFEAQLKRDTERKIKIRNEVQTHLYKMGICPKKDKLVESAIRDSRGKLKLPPLPVGSLDRGSSRVTEAPFSLRKIETKQNNSRTPRTPKRYDVISPKRSVPIILNASKVSEIFGSPITSPRENDHYKLEQLISDCQGMKKHLSKLKSNFKTKQRQKNRQFATIHEKLEAVKLSNFLQNNLIITK